MAGISACADFDVRCYDAILMSSFRLHIPRYLPYPFPRFHALSVYKDRALNGVPQRVISALLNTNFKVWKLY